MNSRSKKISLTEKEIEKLVWLLNLINEDEYNSYTDIKKKLLQAHPRLKQELYEKEIHRWVSSVLVEREPDVKQVLKDIELLTELLIDNKLYGEYSKETDKAIHKLNDLREAHFNRIINQDFSKLKKEFNTWKALRKLNETSKTKM